MNMIVSIRARAYVRAVAVDVWNSSVAPHAFTPSTQAAAPVRRGGLRAAWSLDPVSGRLECRWASEDDVPDSWRCAHSLRKAPKLYRPFRERLAA